MCPYRTFAVHPITILVDFTIEYHITVLIIYMFVTVLALNVPELFIYNSVWHKYNS